MFAVYCLDSAHTLKGISLKKSVPETVFIFYYLVVMQIEIFLTKGFHFDVSDNIILPFKNSGRTWRYLSVRPVELNLITRSVQKKKNRRTLRHTCTNGKYRTFKAKRLSNMDRLPFWHGWRGRFLNCTISFVFPSRFKRMVWITPYTCKPS